MKWIKNICNKYPLRTATVVVVLGLMGYSHYLLDKMFITGSDFITWTLAVWFFALIINLLPSISEFSMGGNVLKLREATQSAQHTLEQMRPFMLGNYRQILQIMKMLPATSGLLVWLGEQDKRINLFWSLQKSIQAEGFEEELVQELKDAARTIASTQLSWLKAQYPTHLHDIISSDLVDLTTYLDPSLLENPAIKAYQKLYSYCAN